MVRLAIVLALGVGAAGCSTVTRAQAPIERPLLDVPPPPPRVIEPAPLPEVAPVEPLPEDLPPPPPDPKPIRRSPREASKTEAQKPEVKPEPTPPTESQPPQSQPAPQLRTPATADTATAQREIQNTITRGSNILAKEVDFHKLSAQLQKEYQNAKDFLIGAETALKASNLELAKELAEKGEKLARSLKGS